MHVIHTFRKRTSTVLTGMALMLLAGSMSSDMARADPVPGETTSVTLDHTRQWQMYNTQGKAYRIMISLPDDPPEKGGYLVLDGNAYFPAFHAARETVARYRDTIIVRIGYPQAQSLNFLRRSYDFTPPVPAEHNEPPRAVRMSCWPSSSSA